MDVESKESSEYKFGFENLEPHFCSAAWQAGLSKTQELRPPKFLELNPHMVISLKWCDDTSMSVWALALGQYEWYQYSQVTTLILAAYLATFFAFISKRVTV